MVGIWYKLFRYDSYEYLINFAYLFNLLRKTLPIVKEIPPVYFKLHNIDPYCALQAVKIRCHPSKGTGTKEQRMFLFVATCVTYI